MAARQASGINPARRRIRGSTRPGSVFDRKVRQTMQNPLLELQEYENLAEALKKGRGPLQVTGTLDSQKVHLM